MMWLLLCHQLIGSMVVWLDLSWRCAVTNGVVVVVSPIDWLYGSLVGSSLALCRENYVVFVVSPIDWLYGSLVGS